VGTIARGGCAVLTLSLLVGSLVTVAPATVSAATVSRAWSAKVGTVGANGTATLQTYTTGTGSLALKLTYLPASTSLPVTLYRGTCAAVGTVLLKLPAIRSSSAGAATRTSSLTAVRVSAIKTATTGTGRIALRVGIGRAAKCGSFAVLPVPPLPHTTVDPSTINGKLLMGYQGWFSCPGDGGNTGWDHWFNSGVPDAAHFRVDMWPDAGELTRAERCPTSMTYPNGSPAYLYSAADPTTVMQHFQWMSQYGIDGVFLQRFVTELSLPNLFAQRNTVTANVRAGAEAYGRVFAVEYAIGNDKPDPNLVSEIETDWKFLVDTGHVTASPSYLHQNGLPVLGIYGLGLNLYPNQPSQAMELVNFFEHNPDPRYRVTLMGGVPGSWRTLTGASLTDPAWAAYYCSINIISPWTVGAFSTDAQVDSYYDSTVAPDMARASQCGAEYMPVVFPGTAFHNSNNGLGPPPADQPFNLIPRRGGELYWRQVYDAVSMGVPMIYNAMFDEVDEDTAMYKIAATASDQPTGVQLVSLDADGQNLPNDWYLRLGGAATKMLRGQIPLTPQIPLNPDGSLRSTFATPPPTFRAQITVQTTADWTTVRVSGATLTGLDDVGSTGAPTIASYDNGVFALNQPLTAAEAGRAVSMTWVVQLSDVSPGSTLTVEIERGNLGATTVTLSNYLGAQPVAVESTTWAGLSGGLNPDTVQWPASVVVEPVGR